MQTPRVKFILHIPFSRHGMRFGLLPVHCVLPIFVSVPLTNEKLKEGFFFPSIAAVASCMHFLWPFEVCVRNKMFFSIFKVGLCQILFCSVTGYMSRVHCKEVRFSVHVFKDQSIHCSSVGRVVQFGGKSTDGRWRPRGCKSSYISEPELRKQ